MNQDLTFFFISTLSIRTAVSKWLEVMLPIAMRRIACIHLFNNSLDEKPLKKRDKKNEEVVFRLLIRLPLAITCQKFTSIHPSK